MTTLSTALAQVREAQITVMTAHLEKVDAMISELDATMASELFAGSTDAGKLSVIRQNLISTHRDVLRQILAGYGVVVDTPLVGETEISLPTPALTVLAFYELFTLEERMAVKAARIENQVIDDFMDRLELATSVDIFDERTVAGVQYLESEGLIGAGRAVAILGPHAAGE